ncbi:MAG: pilus assembly protein PilC [Deltaproteobacteria bacterium RIFOXYA12_FULL_58_15]|nr:MAG: pilus assembly protein PilC [Deltaproteobacteria bacterium RIFOXYA12_FULL_58_15]OGR10569.1 MAG: pilus assembly protein PilC [Deltaproteobacteria bacterium RIFOXYB12_FULL_58_9]
MPIFLWEAKTRSGETKSGEMDVASAEIVNQRLRAQNMQVGKVKKKPMDLNIRMPGSTGITSKDLVVFTRQFATMIDAGLPLVQCLEILGTGAENPELRKVLLDVRSGVESGGTLAESLGKHPKVFDRLFVNLVAAGEAGGVLDTVLNRLAQYIDKSMKLVKQVKSAMVYPVLVLVVSFIVTIVLLVFVIPVFQKMFQDFGSALPAPTQLVVDLSEFTRANIVWLVLIVVGVVVGISTALKNPKGKRLFDKGILYAPIIGPLVQKVAVAKFTRTFGTMLQSGVPILEALEIVAKTAGNAVVEEGLRHVKAQISEGKTMAQPLSEIPVFPAMVVQMISVGEQSGALDTMLTKIADFYDDEVDSAVGTMMGMLEPLIMAFLAVVLGGLVIAMYLPVFSMAGSVQ